MSIELLDKTRKINRLLHNSASPMIAFDDICGTLGKILQSNAVVINDEGFIMGEYIFSAADLLEELHVTDAAIDEALNDRLLSVLSTKENVNLSTLGFEQDSAGRYEAILVPVEIAGRRLGTFFVYKGIHTEEYGIDDIILSEYMANVVGLEMVQEVFRRDREEEQKNQTVNAAMHTLSLSETEAMLEVFDQLDNGEGLIVVGKVADKVGITRSVLVNALRKFESAGIIDAKSSGMKGTYVKVLIPVAYDYLEKFR